MLEQVEVVLAEYPRRGQAVASAALSAPEGGERCDAVSRIWFQLG